MPLAPTVPLWGALCALSLGLDMAMGRQLGHAQATAGLALRLGSHLGLDAAEREALALAALLKDAG